MDPERSETCRITGCDAEPIKGGRCFQHAVHLFLRQRGVLGAAALSQEDETKRASLTLKLRAHYNAVLSGTQEVLSQRQKLSFAWALRDDLKILWGGPPGLMGLAQVIGDVERLVEKEASV